MPAYSNTTDLAIVTGPAANGISGAGAGTLTGGIATSAGDVNGDGYQDVLLTTAGPTAGTSLAYILFGHVGGTGDVDLNSLTGTQGVRLTVDNGTLDASAAGDVNGDGFDDVLLGAVGSSGNAWLVLGKAAGFSNVTLNGTNVAGGIINFNDYANYWGLGATVSGVGDLDNDGFGDFVLGGGTLRDP